MDEQTPQFGPGFLSTFLYYFATTAIVTTFIASKGLHLAVGTGLPQQLGLVLGILAGLLGGYFNRTTHFSVAFTQQKAFLKALDDALSKLGYTKVSSDDDSSSDDENENVLVYRRSMLGRFLSGRVFVQVKPREATIASRAIQLNRIRQEVE
jgi:hypothetical protein